MEKIEDIMKKDSSCNRPQTTDRQIESYRQWIELLEKNASMEENDKQFTCATQLRRYGLVYFGFNGGGGNGGSGGGCSFVVLVILVVGGGCSFVVLVMVVVVVVVVLVMVVVVVVVVL